LIRDIIRQLHAAQKFSIKNEFEFIEFDDITAEEFDAEKLFPDVLEIWAAVKISFEGELPESYKTLNLLIGDWVEAHADSLTTEIHNQLKTHFNENYPDSDSSALDELETSAVWLDQLDYMPLMNENDNSMVIEIELVLHAEPLEGEPSKNV
jgi:hypothetical protein